MRRWSMSSKIILILLSCFFIGCSVKIKVDHLGKEKIIKVKKILSKKVEILKTRALGEHTGTESCTTTGYCFTCAPGFDGKMSCKMKFSAFCSGRKDVKYNLFEEKYIIHYNTDKGKFKSLEKIRQNRKYTFRGSCKR